MLKENLFNQLPKNYTTWSESTASFEEAIVVLDDDPTGTQTVNDVPVLTNWEITTIEEEFSKDTKLFFILTNSRSLKEADTTALHQELSKNLIQASKNANRPFIVVSRSDSTLRGHFPLEPKVLGKALFNEPFLTILIPSFFEGGRYTIGNVHYVEEEDQLIPAGETPFAKDNAFGFSESNLYDWACEKDPSLTKNDIFDLSIAELRTWKKKDVVDKVIKNVQKKVLIVNACNYQDLERFASVLKTALQVAPFNLVFRSAASIVPILGNVKRKPVLTGSEISEQGKAGLIIVGSYVPKTSDQLNELLKHSSVTGFEISVERLLDDDTRAQELIRISNQISELIRDGKSVVAYTSRELHSGKTKEENISIINTVSSGVVQIVRNLTERPGYLIAKGGITSSDIATKSLGIQRAMIMGQALPGIPVWKSGPESKFPDLPYIIFPGNVGTKNSLLELYNKLTLPQ
ncbi:MAG: four-carbon acid sugar kinase family protein [Cyclobacteriaceae bacterium]